MVVTPFASDQVYRHISSELTPGLVRLGFAVLTFFAGRAPCEVRPDQPAASDGRTEAAYVQLRPPRGERGSRGHADHTGRPQPLWPPVWMPGPGRRKGPIAPSRTRELSWRVGAMHKRALRGMRPV